MSFTTIQNWIDNLKELPSHSKRERTFFTITGLRHYENAWSNIYAYYCNPTEDHNLGDVFVRALEQLILKHTHKAVTLNGWWIRREVTANQRSKDDTSKRIDIVIQDWDYSIIIENKVHHILNNDLELYWESIKYPKENKIGLVLSLRPMNIRNDNWINITHFEWITCVKNILSKRENKLDLRTSIYLEDFMATVEQLSNNSQDELVFYLKNREILNQINLIVDRSKDTIQNLFCNKELAKRLGMELVHNAREGAKHRYTMYKLPETDCLVITIVYEFLWKSTDKPRDILLCLEPLGDWWNKVKDSKPLTDIIRAIALKHQVDWPDIPSSFWHCAGKSVSFSDSELLNKEYVENTVARNLSHDEPLMKAAYEIRDAIRNFQNKHECCRLNP